MSERIRTVIVTIEVDTNKRTIVEIVLPETNESDEDFAARVIKRIAAARAEAMS